MRQRMICRLQAYKLGKNFEFCPMFHVGAGVNAVGSGKQSYGTGGK